jgi:hypothetical protein
MPGAGTRLLDHHRRRVLHPTLLGRDFPEMPSDEVFADGD